jgi:predicted lipoprotein with Yx(FWY)xxD motif
MYLFFASKLNIMALVLASFISSAMAAEEMDMNSVNIAANSTLGTYLVNQTGFTLYYLTKDAPGNGTSSCSGECSAIWPPFYVEELTVAQGLNAVDFTVNTRTDGSKQIAYKGWPLYFYNMDTKPKDTNGEGVNKVWFVINPGLTPFKQPTPDKFWQVEPSGSAYFSC